MSLRVEVALEVPFYDVDPMAVAWHGNYPKYFEAARCALLRRIDYDYPQMQASGYLWPVVEMHVKYVRPARYGQRLVVEATLLEYENRLKIAYRIRDVASGENLTKGHSVQVAVHAATGELQFVAPDVLIERVRSEMARGGVPRDGTAATAAKADKA